MDSTILLDVEQIGKQLNLIVGIIVALIGAAIGLWHKISTLHNQIKKEFTTDERA